MPRKNPDQPTPPKLTSREITAALARRHPAKEWIFIEQVRASTGFGVSGWSPQGEWRTGRGAAAIEQSLDAWAMQLWSPREIHAFEVKVSRGDFLREIKDPTKREFGLLVSTRFWFVAPAGLIDPAEVPPDSGLLEVDAAGSVRTRRQAPAHTPQIPDWGFVGSLLRRVCRQGYEQGPGHAGQCDGNTWEQVTEHFPSGEPYSRSVYVHLADSGRWCAKEDGHNGPCLVRGPKGETSEATA